ncbi:MAG: NUDIX hydrolase [Candidatus Aminicenantes bacterium]|nr:NUDIX hydrolase [Candidatus Aminicenantes bacterium]
MSEKDFLFCVRCGAELVDKRIEGRIRRSCESCGYIAYENPVPCSAALVRKENGQILLVNRGVEPACGKWALPSGFIEIDETPWAACIRELKEETGLDGNIIRLIGVYSQKSALYKNVLIVGYEVKAKGKLIPGSDSLDAAFFPLENLPDIPFASHRKIIQDGESKAQ